MTDQPANPTTELRVIIKEDKDGNLTMDYQATVAGSEVLIDMRPSHVAGQLNAAALLVLGQKYRLLKDTTTPAVTHTGEKSRAKRRR